MPRTRPTCLIALIVAAAFAGVVVACGGNSSSSGGPSADAGAQGDVTVNQPTSDAASNDGGGASDAASADASHFADAGIVSVSRDGGLPISPFAYGNNYWNWVSYGGAPSGLTGTEPAVTALHLNVLRAGGINNDTNSPQPFDTTQIDKYVTYCRTVGAEPILQVPLVANPVDGGAATAQTAADMVTYANVTKGYGIQYWEIGNEADQYFASYDAGVPLDPVSYCNSYMAYATAMKQANAAAVDGGVPMKFVGPDLAWKYIPGNDWLTPFLDACKSVIDVVSVHRYPFSETQLTTTAALSDARTFRTTLASLRAIVSGHASPGTPLAITESNVSYQYDPTKYPDAALPSEPGTFPAALWTADVSGVALETQLWTLAFWNLAEQSATGSVLGFIVAGQPVPSYYAAQMFSANFRGDELLPTGVPTGFAVYASHDPIGAMTAVVVINKTMVGGSIAIAIDSVPPQPVDAPAFSITLAKIPDDPAGATHVWWYTADLAGANMPPSQVR